jgi:phosphoglycolate phosphatase
MTETHLIVFDVDGTLIDSQHLIVAAMETAFAGLDLAPPPRAEILGIVGLSLPAAAAALAPHLPAADLGRLEAGYRAEFMAQRERGGAEAHAPLYPGARAALERLASDPTVQLGVATGKARRGLDHVLDSLGLEDFFVTTQTADEHPSKPHPSMLETALLETGLPAARAVMVGDTDFDILMGKAAGFATIGVAWGYHPRARLEAAGADRVIEDFGALDAALADLRGSRA